MTTSFYITWENQANGNQFETSYIYDGCGRQSGLTLIDWWYECYLFGKSNGFRYVESRCPNYKG